MNSATGRISNPPAAFDDARLLAALRAGDEAAFVALVDRLQPALLRLARLYLDSPEAAAEVVQETWLAVLEGLDRFEGRATLKTWIFRILTNLAKTRGRRDGRTIPFSSLWDPDREPVEPAVDPTRFRPPDASGWAGGWITFPHPWEQLPEAHALAAETRALLDAAVAALPPAQREVITLRDIEGWNSEEVCNVLGLSETNQRVLLHRARSKVRGALEQYVGQGGRLV